MRWSLKHPTNATKSFAASRYGKGGGDDYLNLPLTKDEYVRFVAELKGGQKLTPHAFEEPKYFEGFLPIKPGRRLNRLKALHQLDTTLVLYESPHRIVATLGAIGEVFGDVEVVVARELTKQYEEIVTATPTMHVARLAAATPRGEFTVVIPAGG